MAIRVEIFNNFEINGNTYTGSFPIFSTDAICSVEQKEDVQSQIQKDLETIAEN